MRTANTRIKVRRETLISKLTAEVERRERDHQRKLEKYECDRLLALARLEEAIEDYLALMRDEPEKALERVEGSYRGRSATVKFPNVGLPDEPSDRETGRIRRMLSVLEAAEDETISISAEDEYARFL